MSSDLSFQSLTALARLLREGRTTSTAIVEACLAQIAAHDQRLHAFVDLYRDEALACAHAADLERGAGMARGPLHGLPIALKDLLHLRGRPTTAGSKSWQGRIADHTATAVEHLLAAGMIVLGKTHMVEFAFGGWGRNAPMGAPWNPWDPTIHRVAGGSSSGSAVAVAAGLAPAAIGSDTGGSVRIPAALCGLTGLKPTYGLVSLHGAVPLSHTLDSIGPLTHSVEDAALLTAAMAGPDPHDPATLTAPRFDLEAALGAPPDLRGMRITALAREQFPGYIDPEVVHARDTALTVLRELGASVDEARIPFDVEDLAARNGKLIAAEAYAVHRAYIEDEALEIDPWVRKRMVAGKSIGAADYIDELAARRATAARFAEWMRHRDALLSPTLPITATPVEEVDEATTPLALFTRAVNYLGACALSLPAGLSSRRLPIGVQLIGAPFTDATLLRIGRGFQSATDWHRQRP
jgi:aspartyl-tRNA(Asn)/glutamyl-tRNA(Gln) amidotransferase subunit A